MNIDNRDAFPYAKTFMERVGHSVQRNESVPERFVVCPWPDPRTCPVLVNDDWQLFSEEIVPAANHVMKTWELVKDDQYISITVYVFDRFQSALKRFLSIGSLSSSSIFPYQRGPQDLGHYSAMSVLKSNCRYFWVYHNVVFDIDCRDTAVEIEKILHWLHRSAIDHTFQSLAGRLPSTSGISISSHRVNIRESVTIDIDLPSNVQAFCFWDGDGLVMIDEAADCFEFSAVEELTATVTIAAVDLDTLMVNTKTFTIEVK